MGVLKSVKDALKSVKKSRDKRIAEDKRIVSMYRSVAKKHHLVLKIEAEHVGFYNARIKKWGEVSFYNDITRASVIRRLKQQGVL